MLLLFWFVIPTRRGVNLLSPAFREYHHKRYAPAQDVPLELLVLDHMFWGSTSKEREEAGSLTTLGMTNQKGKSKNIARRYSTEYPCGIHSLKSAVANLH